MKILAEILPSGQIYSVGQFPDDINPDPLNGGTFYEISERVSPETYYWNGTEVVEIPPSPNVNFKFNYATGTWEDVRTLAEAKAFQVNLIQQMAVDWRLKGFKLNQILYSSDINSQANIISLTQAAQEALNTSTPFTATITREDGSTESVDAFGIIRIGLALATYLDSIASHANAKVDEITSKTVNGDVYSIVWDLQELPDTWNKKTLAVDGTDSVVINSLPVPSYVKITAPGAVGAVNVVEETDGVFDMTTTVPGKYLITISSPKYISLVSTITAV